MKSNTIAIFADPNSLRGFLIYTRNGNRWDREIVHTEKYSGGLFG